MNNIKFMRLHNDAKMPTKAYEFAAAYDLYPVSSGYLIPGAHSIIPLGFATEFDPNYVALIFDRSGLAIRGVTHFAGVIDSDYRGEYKVILFNSTNESVHYSPDNPIAQLIFVKKEDPEWTEVVELSESKRGEKGFGSSDQQVGRVFDVGVGMRSKGGIS